MGSYVYIWVYDVLPARTRDFIELYGSGGSWSQLFARSPGYLGTDLLRDLEREARFVTIDHWDSKRAFRHFRRRFGEEFDRLDELGSELTLSETMLGEFELDARSGKGHPPI